MGVGRLGSNSQRDKTLIQLNGERLGSKSQRDKTLIQQNGERLLPPRRPRKAEEEAWLSQSLLIKSSLYGMMLGITGN